MLWVAIGFVCAGISYQSCTGLTAEHLFSSEDACIAWSERQAGIEAARGLRITIGCTDVDMPPPSKPKERSS